MTVLTDHLPLLAGAPNGIKKLRELILELAVRGKLVPQDPSDEPASELLKRIGTVGGLRDELEGSFRVPESWVWVRFGEVALHNAGKTLDKGRNSGELRDYITTSNLYWGRFELSSVRQMQIEESELERCTARKGDLLICEGGEAGRAAVWDGEREVCFQNHIHRARFFGDLVPHYFYRLFERLNATGEINQYRKGVAISSMSGKTLSLIPFPLAPLEEQHRIVAKVDELMALCDTLETQQASAESALAQLVQALLASLTQASDADDFAASWQRLSEHFDTLFTTEASIDALKQTVLQLAVMGKLVTREAADDATSLNEPQKLMLKEDEPFPIPSHWRWSTLGAICSLVTSGSRGWKAFYAKKGSVFIRSQDIKLDRLEFDNKAFVKLPLSAEGARTLVSKDDLLITITGANVGKAANITDAIEDAYVSQHVALLRLGEPRVSPFIHRWLVNSHGGRSLLLSSSYGAKPGLNLQNIKDLPVPLPPLAEQHRIVAKVDELMSLCDQLKSRMRQARNLNQQLASTLVERAVA